MPRARTMFGVEVENGECGEEDGRTTKEISKKSLSLCLPLLDYFLNAVRNGEPMSKESKMVASIMINQNSPPNVCYFPGFYSL